MKEFIPAKTIKLAKIKCNVCQKEYNLTNDDKHFSIASEAAEFQSLSWEAGYGASGMFKDCHRYELDICQSCLAEKLGPYIIDRGMFGSSSADQASSELLGPDESDDIRANLDMLDS